MEMRELGETQLKVSRLCFGSLTMGPLQANLTPKDGGNLLLHGFERGINFIDTAELYESYAHIKEALKAFDRKKIVLSTKSYAYSKETAEASLNKALKELGTDYIDVFMLHEQESEHTLRGHEEALKYFFKMKDKGLIRAVGISTHTIAAVKSSLHIKEIEVLHPIVNLNGLGIQDGTIEEMLTYLEQARQLGKGIYAMKPLGGGNLLKNFEECFDFVLNIPYLDSIAVGMQSIEEIDMNCLVFNHKPVDKDLLTKVMNKKRQLRIAHWCEACGKCVEACGHGALRIEKDQVVVDHRKCVLCGYCSKYCPQFCIKVV
ncbi:aldo/keto reductase [Alkaliphilus metalliredigens QYMF]|uniref:Aldo/keto reductase n=1 Tax=Alkaliphilus metalliredigens (strain QYMF) TaxID=293826 RepID=A6TQZ7_ALKMQ|nr:aldo/keto reductase [Alkaliphilus metalliredigens]ABR48615.1 aldo/keto reductase [Alkaliphilus metalliredigens QYMF]